MRVSFLGIVASNTICKRGLRVAWCCGLLYHLQESNQTELLGTVTFCTICRRGMRLSCLVLCTVIPSAGRDEVSHLVLRTVVPARGVVGVSASPLLHWLVVPYCRCNICFGVSPLVVWHGLPTVKVG